MSPAFLRALFVLGRVSNLPTVWTNCLAGWTLAGGTLGFSAPLLTLCIGCSLLYVGGMYLNDACDVEFDTEHRPERPIPSGIISRRAVTAIGIFWLVAGTAALILSEPSSLAWTLVLLALIVAYDLFHKQLPLAPVLMAGCREVIYLVAATAAGTPFLAWPRDVHTGTPLLLQAAIAMGAWILTLSVLARTESVPGPFRKVVFSFLLLPFVLGFIAHGIAALFPAMLLALWLYRCFLFFRVKKQIGPIVGDLIAGIPLIDLLLVSPPTPVECLPYLGCMALALILRRSIPAT